MAAKKNSTDATSKPGSSSNRGGWGSIVFLNPSLTEAQKLAYGKWEDSNPDISLILDETLASGYKLSYGYDEKSLSYMCTLTNRSGDPAFTNHCFTLRARTAWQAMGRVLWLHSVHCEGDWREFADPDIDSDVW